MIIPPPKDGYTHTRHESDKLTAFAGKSVHIEFTDGSEEAGFLHIDTLATRCDNPACDNKRIIGYYIENPSCRIHFKKSHVKNISRCIEI